MSASADIRPSRWSKEEMCRCERKEQREKDAGGDQIVHSVHPQRANLKEKKKSCVQLLVKKIIVCFQVQQIDKFLTHWVHNLKLIRFQRHIEFILVTLYSHLSAIKTMTPFLCWSASRLSVAILSFYWFHVCHFRKPLQPDIIWGYWWNEEDDFRRMHHSQYRFAVHFSMQRSE